MPPIPPTYCSSHEEVRNEVVALRSWREQHDRSDMEFREEMREAWKEVRGCIEGKDDRQTDRRRGDIAGVHEKIDRLKTLMISTLVSAMLSLAGLVGTLIVLGLQHKL